MKRLFLILATAAIAAHAAQWPSGYSTATAVNDSDPVMIAQSGVMKAAPASLLRTIQSTNISDSTATGRSLLTVASVAAARTTLGLAIGTDVQAYSANLAAFSGLTGSANKGVYFTGAGALALYDLSTFARTILDDADAAAVRATLGLVIGTDVQAFNTKLAAMAAATQAADTLFYYTGATAGTSTPLTSFGRSLIDDADAAAARTTLGLVIGTNVQAYHANLAAIAGGTWTGASSITTLGTIATGTWQGTAIASTYMAAGTTAAQGALALATQTDVDNGINTSKATTPATIAARYLRAETASYSIATTGWKNILSNSTNDTNFDGILIISGDNNSGAGFAVTVPRYGSYGSIKQLWAGAGCKVTQLRVHSNGAITYVDANMLGTAVKARWIEGSGANILALKSTETAAVTPSGERSITVAQYGEVFSGQSASFSVDSLTVNGNVISNGTHNTLPNQTAPDGPSAMNRDLGDVRWSPPFLPSSVGYTGFTTAPVARSFPGSYYCKPLPASTTGTITLKYSTNDKHLAGPGLDQQFSEGFINLRVTVVRANTFNASVRIDSFNVLGRGTEPYVVTPYAGVTYGTPATATTVAASYAAAELSIVVTFPSFADSVTTGTISVEAL